MGERERVTRADWVGQTRPELLSTAMVAFLDRVVSAGRPCELDSYGQIIGWAADVAARHGTAQHWVKAQQPALHEAANLGPLVMVDIDAEAVARLYEVLRNAQGVVTYTPTVSTAIWWLLDIAEQVASEQPDG